MFSDSREFTIYDSTFNNVAGPLNYLTVHGGIQVKHGETGKGIKALSQNAIMAASHDSEQRYPPPNCHPGTRVHMLNSLRRWILDDSKTTSVYWLYGPAGVGKSAIAQAISEEFSDRGKQPSDRRLAASFFFARLDSSRNNLGLFFTTIAHQLVTNPALAPFLKDSVGSAILKNPRIIHATLEQQFQELIADPCSHLSVDWTNLPRLIVIDGLDECVSISSQECLLSILGRAKSNVSRPLPFEFIICSRPEPRIQNAFNHQNFRDILNQNYIGDSFESSQDVATLLRYEFGRIRGQIMADVPSDWPGEETIQRLVRRACGQFIYATTVLKYVGDFHGLPTERLEIILNLAVPEDYESPYPDLDLLYTQILSTCKEKELLLDVFAHLLRPRSGIFFSQDVDHASSSHIEGLFVLPEGKIWALLFGLHSVLFIPANDFHSIAIQHRSLVDFLTDPKRSGTYFVNRSTASLHDRITQYLLKRIFRSITKTRSQKRKKSIFDSYAWDFWGKHCCTVFKHPSAKLLAMLEQLDLCAVLTVGLQRRYGSMNACLSWLKETLTNFGKIARWAESVSRHSRHKSSLESLHEKFRLLEPGFQIQMPSNSDPSLNETMTTAILVFKYAYFVDQDLHLPDSDSGNPRIHTLTLHRVIASLLKHRLNAKQVRKTLHSPWSCPPIHPLHPDHASRLSISTSHSNTVHIDFRETKREVATYLDTVTGSTARGMDANDNRKLFHSPVSSGGKSPSNISLGGREEAELDEWTRDGIIEDRDQEAYAEHAHTKGSADLESGFTTHATTSALAVISHRSTSGFPNNSFGSTSGHLYASAPYPPSTIPSSPSTSPPLLDARILRPFTTSHSTVPSYSKLQVYHRETIPSRPGSPELHNRPQRPGSSQVQFRIPEVRPGGIITGRNVQDPDLESDLLKRAADAVGRPRSVGLRSRAKADVRGCATVVHHNVDTDLQNDLLKRAASALRDPGSGPRYRGNVAGSSVAINTGSLDADLERDLLKRAASVLGTQRVGLESGLFGAQNRGMEVAGPSEGQGEETGIRVPVPRSTYTSDSELGFRNRGLYRHQHSQSPSDAFARSNAHISPTESPKPPSPFGTHSRFDSYISRPPNPHTTAFSQPTSSTSSTPNSRHTSLSDYAAVYTPTSKLRESTLFDVNGTRGKLMKT